MTGPTLAGAINAALRDAMADDERVVVFRDPQLFDPTRGDNRHIGFGFGPHYCLGATVARIMLRIFSEEFLGFFKDVESAGEPVRLASNFVSGYPRVPLRTRVRRSLARRAGEPIRRQVAR